MALAWPLHGKALACAALALSWHGLAGLAMAWPGPSLALSWPDPNLALPGLALAWAVPGQILAWPGLAIA